MHALSLRNGKIGPSPAPAQDLNGIRLFEEENLDGKRACDFRTLRRILLTAVVKSGEKWGVVAENVAATLTHHGAGIHKTDDLFGHI